jgi:hypothetical protein
MGNLLCMGLFLRFFLSPLPVLDVAYNGLTALVDVYVFHSDFLLSFATITVERFNLGSEGAG